MTLRDRAEALLRELDRTVYAWRCYTCQQAWKIYQSEYHDRSCKHYASYHQNGVQLVTGPQTLTVLSEPTFEVGALVVFRDPQSVDLAQTVVESATMAPGMPYIRFDPDGVYWDPSLFRRATWDECRLTKRLPGDGWIV